MSTWQKKIYFDKQDRELLSIVNRLLNAKNEAVVERTRSDANLHPHGIISLATPREMRIATSVTRLLSSLEAGQAEDRLHALQSLYDEVLTTAQSAINLIDHFFTNKPSFRKRVIIFMNQANAALRIKGLECLRDYLCPATGT